MTDIVTAALRALMEKATRGPFSICNYSDDAMSIYGADEYRVAGLSLTEGESPVEDEWMLMDANAELLAAALNALPALLDAYEARERLRQALSVAVSRGRNHCAESIKTARELASRAGC